MGKLLTTLLSVIGMSQAQAATSETSIYQIQVKDINGQLVTLEKYKNQVLLIVNVASKCGFTYQYEGLEKIYAKYKDQGLVVLGFPSNDFGGQEPGTEAEIKNFCQLNYKVDFPLFAKGPVSGDDIQPLFKYLTTAANPDHTGRVLWNFEKFVINRQGKLVDRFRSITKPESEKITGLIEKLLKD